MNTNASTPRYTSYIVLGLLAVMALARQLQAAPSTDEVNAANNPLTPKITANIHNYYQELYGTDDYVDSMLFRGVMPHKLGDIPQILRATLPLVIAPDRDGDEVTGLGDLNVIDLLITKHGNIDVGIGPQLTLPTATRDETGAGKWQAGLASVVMAPQKWGMLGGLITWQASFAGDGGRASQNNLTLQPLILYNLPEGWYLRSTGIWNFQLNYDHAYSIPIGIGIGKVVTLKSGTTLNFFVEPQWTVAHHGDGVPKFQLFAGVNFQFPIHMGK